EVAHYLKAQILKQDLRADHISVCSSKRAPWFAKLPIQSPYPQYLSKVAKPKWRNALTSLGCLFLVTAVVEGHYQLIPLEERICPC
ncbi:hypothetical protein JRQ81_017625, partial [Phrynocephalus forsythii]